MAQPQRNDLSHADFTPVPERPARLEPPSEQTIEHRDYALGGQVGQMHADLARRLGVTGADLSFAERPEDRVVRLLSVAGGFTALLACYAGVTFLFLR